MIYIKVDEMRRRVEEMEKKNDCKPKFCWLQAAIKLFISHQLSGVSVVVISEHDNETAEAINKTT